MKALLERYPDYHLRVFPTPPQRCGTAADLRCHSFHAVSAELIANGNGIQGAAAGIPSRSRRAASRSSGTTSCITKGDQSHMINNQAVVIGGRANYIKRDRHVYYVYNREG